MFSLVWLSFYVLTYIASLLDTDRDNVEWAWTLALFVLLVLAHCRTITLRIGSVFHEEYLYNCSIELEIKYVCTC